LKKCAPYQFVALKNEILEAEGGNKLKGLNQAIDEYRKIQAMKKAHMD